MKYPVLLALALSCCAGPKPPVFAFGAIQCQEVRPVACVTGDNLDAQRCADLVGGAVGVVNAAVGYALFDYVGVILHDTAGEAALAQVLVVEEGDLKPGYLGITNVHEYQHCLSVVHTTLSSAMLRGDYDIYGVEPLAVASHELLHALGAGHADGATQSFAGVMAPAVSDAHFATALTELDAVTLRFAYPWRLQLARRINALLGRKVL